MRSYPDLLLADCIYKTNRYHMPLLHFLGVTPIYCYFSARFCLLPSKDTSCYEWALNVFKDLVLHNLDPPRAFLLDKEDALKLAAIVVFPIVL